MEIRPEPLQARQEVIQALPGRAGMGAGDEEHEQNDAEGVARIHGQWDSR